MLVREQGERQGFLHLHSSKLIYLVYLAGHDCVRFDRTSSRSSMDRKQNILVILSSYLTFFSYSFIVDRYEIKQYSFGNNACQWISLGGCMNGREHQVKDFTCGQD